jgi:hypothetical protein
MDQRERDVSIAVVMVHACFIFVLAFYVLFFQLSGLGLSFFLIESICDGIPTGSYWENNV